MIIVNGKVLEINRFPDGTLLIKEDPYYTKTVIRWKFENNEELVALIFLTKHLRSHGVKDICLEMLYIPNARQDRVKKREDVFMKTFHLMLNSINDVKDFVNIVSRYDFDVDLTSGRYVVDAKSIMGIFSLNLSKPIKVEVHSDDCDEFMANLERFMVE